MTGRGGSGGFGRGLLRVLAVMISLAVFCTLSYSLWDRYQGLMEVEAEIEQVEQEMQRELQLQKELETKRDKLEDPAYIELLARQELGLVRPEDVPYQWHSR